MRAQIGKWGNSLALRIPGPMAREIAACEGKAVDISVEAGRLIVVPVTEAPSYALDELIAAISDDNRHDEVATGQAVGHEFA